jgi:hypothetical protein
MADREITEFLSGPWIVGKDGFRWFIGTADGITIAHEIERAGDARLLAAAPELLEALQAVVAVADRKTNEFDRARAAIAKATGRA